MPSDSGTVIAAKSAFLRAQIRILTQPLQPTDKWRDGSAIPRTVLDDVMNEGESPCPLRTVECVFAYIYSSKPDIEAAQ
jgi:hypothetical protein